MDVSVKKLSASRVELSVSLPWNEWKKELEHAAEHVAQETKIPGFRPGKAPRNVIEKRFGKGAVLAEAAEHAVSHSYGEALRKEKIEALGHPEITLGKLAEGESLSYTAVTAVMPEVKLKDWKGAVKKVNARFVKTEEAVTDEEVEAEMNRLALMRAKLITVAREAKKGDNVLIDFTVTKDGVVIEGGKSENHPLVLGENVFIPGFEDELLGMKEGEEKTFTLTFPAEYHAKHLAGQPAEFSVKVRVVQEREAPVLDDAFAKSLGHFDSLEQVKKNIQEGMTEEKKMKRREESRSAILDALSEQTTIDFPAILVEEELSRMIREFESQVARMGTSLAEYLERTQKTEAVLRTEWEPQAKKRLLAQFALETIADDQSIDVESAEIEVEMNKALQYYRNVKDAEKRMDMERLYTAVRGQLRNEKTFEYLEKL